MENPKGESDRPLRPLFDRRPTHSEIKTRTPSRNPSPPCTLVGDLARWGHDQPHRRTSHGESQLIPCTPGHGTVRRSPCKGFGVLGTGRTPRQ